MRRICILTLIAVLLPLMLSAQPTRTLQSMYYEFFMYPFNEVPPAAVGGEFAHAYAEIHIHASRDNDTHELVEAWVNFHIEYFFDLPQNLVAMHIHKGRFRARRDQLRSRVGQVEVVIEGSSFVMTRVFDDARAFARRHFNGFKWNVTAPEGLAAIEGIFGDSEAFYLNLHSTEFPGGVLRGDLQTKEISYLRHLNGHDHFNEFLIQDHGETSGAEHVTVTDKLYLIVDRQRRILGALGILTREEAAETE